MLAARLPHTPLDEFFEEHRSAIVLDDMARVIDMFSYPVTFHDGQRSVVVHDREEAERAYGVLRAYYEDIGMAEIETRWVLQHRVSADFFLADMFWRLFDEEGTPLRDERSTYALRPGPDGLRVVAVFLHEDEAPACGHA